MFVYEDPSPDSPDYSERNQECKSNSRVATTNAIVFLSTQSRKQLERN